MMRGFGVALILGTLSLIAALIVCRLAFKFSVASDEIRRNQFMRDCIGENYALPSRGARCEEIWRWVERDRLLVDNVHDNEGPQ